MARGKINYHDMHGIVIQVIRNKYTLLKDTTSDWLESLMASTKN